MIDQLARDKGVNGLTAHGPLAVGTADSVGIITILDEAASEAGKSETIGTGLQDGFTSGRIAFIVIIAIVFVWIELALFAICIAAQLLSRLTNPLCNSYDDDDSHISIKKPEPMMIHVRRRRCEKLMAYQ